MCLLIISWTIQYRSMVPALTDSLILWLVFWSNSVVSYPSPFIAYFCSCLLGPLAQILQRVVELCFLGFLVSCFVLNVVHGWLQFWTKHCPRMRNLPFQEILEVFVQLTFSFHSPLLLLFRIKVCLLCYWFSVSQRSDYLLFSLLWIAMQGNIVDAN